MEPHGCAIDHSSEHAIELGKLIAHWAIVELYLSSILTGLLGIEQSRGSIVYAEFSSLGVKFKLMRRLIHTYLIENDPKRDELIKLLGDAQKLSDVRNKYAHALWLGNPATKGELTLAHGTAPNDPKKRLRPDERVTAAMIREDVRRISVLSKRLEQFVGLVLPTMTVRITPLT